MGLRNLFLSLSLLAVLLLTLGWHRKDSYGSFIRDRYSNSTHERLRMIDQEPDRCRAELTTQGNLLRQEYAKTLKGIEFVALVGFPNHPNKGDSAIWVGESILLKYLDIGVIHVFSELRDYNATRMRSALASRDSSKTAILLHGGGNFGDLWYHHQLARERVIKDFPDYPIRSFPQTYKFQNSERLRDAQRAYATHADLQLVARDTRSYLAMRRDFSQHHAIDLLPDIAVLLLGIDINVVATPKYDFMIQTRTDGEGGQHHQNAIGFGQLTSRPSATSGKFYSTVKIGDWLDSDPADLDQVDFNHKAWQRVEAAMRFLKLGKVLITDRLHAHILGLLWDIPHVVLEEGAYGKIADYQDTWLAAACGQRAALTHTVHEAVESAKDLYALQKEDALSRRD